jgi:hypothetical protein
MRLYGIVCINGNVISDLPSFGQFAVSVDLHLMSYCNILVDRRAGVGWMLRLRCFPLAPRRWTSARRS